MSVFTLVTMQPHQLATPRSLTILQTRSLARYWSLPETTRRTTIYGRYGEEFKDFIKNPFVVILYITYEQGGMGNLETLFTVLFADMPFDRARTQSGQFQVDEGGRGHDHMLAVILVCRERDCGNGLQYNKIKRWTSDSPKFSCIKTTFSCQPIIAITHKITSTR